jgi:hypothetical protein
MKAILIVSSLFFCAFSITNPELDKANGFENFKFGTTPAEYKNLNLEIDEGTTKLYSLNTLPQINNAQLEYVRLTFCKNRLSAISIGTKNSSASKFMHYLLDNFGPAKTTKQNSEWKSQKVHLIYEQDSSGKDAIINYYSNEICKNSVKDKK